MSLALQIRRNQTVRTGGQVINRCGVYAVYLRKTGQNICLYVGASKNLKRRLEGVLYSKQNIYLWLILKHFRENRKDYTIYVDIHNCEPHELEVKEQLLINELRPKTNSTKHHHYHQYSTELRKATNTNGLMA